jgi:hypothetical protein
LKTKTNSIKGHEYHIAQSSYHLHDLTYQGFYKTHVSHGNKALSSIAETNSRGLDAFTTHCTQQRDLETHEEDSQVDQSAGAAQYALGGDHPSQPCNRKPPKASPTHT